MDFGTREFELLKRLNFIRPCGTDEEKQAAQILAKEAESLGASVKVEPFEVDHWNIEKVSLQSEGKEWEVTGYGLSGSTPAEGITAPFAYVQDGTEMDLVDAKGKIVLLNGRITDEVYPRLIKAGVLGFITFQGNVIDKPEDTDLNTPNLRDWALKSGKLPGVQMRAAQALELVRQNPKTITLTLIQQEDKATSQNVIADLPGSEPNGQLLVFGAHYDSVPFSHGVYDNGAGSVIIMELLRYFKEHPVKRDLRFCWFGSEERGLLGSKAYVAAHEAEMKDVALMINVDVAAPVLGRDVAMVTADDGLRIAVEYQAKEQGFPIGVRQDIYSSDSIPFADKGVPGINFCRFGAPGGANIHCRHDVIDPLAPENLNETTKFILSFSQRMADAVVFPVPHSIPANIVEKVDKYLKKEPKEKK